MRTGARGRYWCRVGQAFAGEGRVSCEALGASGSSRGVLGAVRGAMASLFNRSRKFECPGHLGVHHGSYINRKLTAIAMKLQYSRFQVYCDSWQLRVVQSEELLTKQIQRVPITLF
jgi:hypothetical protein